MSQNFSISDSAARRITQLLSSTEAKGSMLRISVAGGGCSGFQYSFLFDDTVLADDKVFEKNTAKVVIDEISLGLLQESILDYVEDMVASTFVIKNPNAASSCGCGNSFSI
ncbi:iron-sulfur cluster insertion protein ErpA [Candidatus Odyssella acanthamoebae]|uniref:Heme biosynthesis protein HemY n=1 Tax=Candidatus Odyssella acanthamoebae TaxID=91604 RepID=A0A077AS88_9PROT|nr:iron-sulfur cluster insertion protein ErpA [Candidatus Paracaedibacter acanthamoebae]AIK96037.1 heme biosynthesis protein HemY [Candidatus Paracaedibacter acanthamoebae]